jgi:hypothetical protein
MMAADRCYAYAGLLRFRHDREPFFVREAASVRSTVTRRLARDTGCHGNFSRPVTSSAANVAAYLGVGARMKPRSPVNFDLATIDQSSPAAKASFRELRRRGMLRERHSAPVQRLDMHLPERLRRLVALVRRQLERSSFASPSTLVALGFRQGF